MIHWFKKHPDFLRRESHALSNDKNYKELHQVRNNLFVSHGNIIVRLDKIYKFPFLIIYPEATPYTLPLFFPLENELTEQEVVNVSMLDVDNIRTHLSNNIKFYYHLRHQNASGVLCILEWDNLDDGSKFYGITTIIKRVRDWCSGLVTNNFPLDSQEVEFTSHFNNLNHELRLLVPDTFFDSSLIEGFFYATLYSFHPKGEDFLYDRRFYVGNFLDGKTSNGLYMPTAISAAGLPESIKTVQDLLTHNKPQLDLLIQEKRILKGNWFSISKEPSPFKNFDELVVIIGDGSYEQGRERIFSNCYEDLKNIPDEFLIAIRFPNRKGILEFQVFKIIITPQDERDIPTISIDVKEQFNYKLKLYREVQAIVCEKITEKNFYERNGDRANFNTLKDININIVGVGAIGSEIADSMGKAGIGHLRLIDNQILQAHNSVRHLAGFEFVGELKAKAVQSIIKNHNPFINVLAGSFNVLSTDINEYILQDSLSISSIADDNVEGFLNEQAVISNSDFFYVRALRGGKVARIFRVIPGKDACFNCLNLYKNEGNEFISIPEDPQYPTIRNECNNPIRPASAADLKTIASVASRIIIDYLQNGSDYNHWIWSTEDLTTNPSISAYSIVKQVIPVHPLCQYCNHEIKHKSVIESSVLEMMRRLVNENNKIETGGVLAGYIDNSNTIVITHASEPGPKSIRSDKKFKKDIEYCQQFLDELYKKYGSKAVYLGEWHSHPSTNNNPSSTDIKSLIEISYQKEYLTDKPIMIIMSNEGNPSCTIHPTGKSFYFCNLKVLNN